MALMRPTCPCDTRCRYCGARRRLGSVGHYCPTPNCQWQHGYATCTLAASEPENAFLDTLAVLAGRQRFAVQTADAVDWLRQLPDASVDLILGSPPYCDARSAASVYSCQEWVAWMLKVTTEAVRVSRGLVLWVAAGIQRRNVYWPACEGLMWEWYRRGGEQWCPAVWWKVDENARGTGVPGSGGHHPGRRGLRKDWEYVMQFRRPGPLPYDHPEVNGTPSVRRPGQVSMDAPAGKLGNGQRMANTARVLPARSNPGNVLRVPADDCLRDAACHKLIVKARVGGGRMGSKLCHGNEAPFPESLAAFWVQAYAAPDAVVCDPFTGSGTTLSVALQHGRRFVGCDVRQSQVDLAWRRAGETLLAMDLDPSLAGHAAKLAATRMSQ